MTWFRVDDTLAAHAKARRAGLPAMGLWVLAGAYASQQLTDGFVPDWFVVGWPSGRKHADRLVQAGLWTQATVGGETGWCFHDWAQANPSREQVLAERKGNARRQALFRDADLRDAVKVRDRDRCRYCGQLVVWNANRSAQGGTYDHVDPAGGNTSENLVVACRACNARKHNRTPEQAGMVLLDPGAMGADASVTRHVTRRERVARRVSNEAPTRPDPTPRGTKPLAPLAAAPEQSTPETDGARANRLAKTYVDAVPLSNFPAVAGVVRKAVRSGRYDDTEIRAALERLATEGRSVTVDTLRIELDGMPGRRRPAGGPLADRMAVGYGDADRTAPARTLTPDEWAAEGRSASGGTR